jgi:hypothetical protein
MNVDEAALNVLLAEGESLPIALAGSISDEPQPPLRAGRKPSPLMWISAITSAIAATALVRWALL